VGCTFQCSSASRKFLNTVHKYYGMIRCYVSVLFSEPKIPQSIRPVVVVRAVSVSVLFSEPKIPQLIVPAARHKPGADVSVLFSEPKIPQFIVRAQHIAPGMQFQCSSASRKFLNSDQRPLASRRPVSFSALQRAENSSIICVTTTSLRTNSAFQCSSASRKFLNFTRRLERSVGGDQVSVLFSEPKIPQFAVW